jgi:uncharacterized phage protein (TIGR01671 family)
MREIIFKAKRLDNSEWVEGYGVIQYKEYNEATIIHKQGNNITQHTAVDPKTVCQYTGLTDKNGNKIWEGDVNEDLGYVFWNKDFAAFQWRYPNGDVMEFESEEEWCIIIGNIFDNPELLSQ